MGLIPDPPQYLNSLPKAPRYQDFIPDRVDLTDDFPDPGDQGSQGSCVGWAVGYAARAYYAKHDENRDVSREANIPSPAYIYGSIRRSPDCSAGSSISAALDLLKSGSVSWAVMPYSQQSCPTPDATVQRLATDFRIDSWEAVDLSSLDQVKHELAAGNPVILSLRVTPPFLDLKPGQIYNNPSSVFVGYHAIVAVGYDEAKQAFLLLNSWGSTWGDSGFGWIDYDTFKSEVQAAYVMRVARAEPRPFPTPHVPDAVVLPSLPCSKLSTVTDESGATKVVGFVGSNEDLARVRSLAPNSTIEVAVRPFPQCEALMTLDRALGETDRPTIKIRKRTDGSLKDGDRLIIDVTTPNYTSYLHLAYFSADRNVTNIIQSGVGTYRSYPPNSRVTLGEDPNGITFDIAGPDFGNEMIMVLAARSPVFPVKLPTTEADRDFLTEVRKAILYGDPSHHSDREIGAAIDTVTTVPR